MPDVTKANGNKIVEEFNKAWQEHIGGSGVESYFADIVACQQLLLITFGTAFLLGFIYMVILRLCGGPIIYFSIVGIIGGIAYGAFMLYQVGTDMEEGEKYKQYYIYGSYAVAGVAGFLLLCVLCQCKNIRIGVAVMKCTAAFIGGTPQVFLVPPFAAIIIVAWFIVWAVIALFIWSVGEIGPNPDLPFLTSVKWTEETRYVFIYSLFGYLWINAFIIGTT